MTTYADGGWSSLPRPLFSDRREYGRRFTDPLYWRPYIEEIARRHEMGPAGSVRPGRPGTHPVFLVNERWVVKLFSDLFSGETGFATEREVYALLERDRGFPAPRLLAEGALFRSGAGWRWPYLVSTMLPGDPLVDCYDRVSEENREAIAGYLAGYLKRLHHCPLPTRGPLRRDWEPFRQWMTEQRERVVENHREWGGLPGHLAAQLDEYLLPIEELLTPTAAPVLLHADLNADHLLGSFSTPSRTDEAAGPARRGTARAPVWTPTGIIDFGDAKMGDFLYELQALHVGLFRCNGGLLRTFLKAYDAEAAPRRGFVHRAMSFTLLHEFDLVTPAFEHLPAAASSATLKDLAKAIWGGVV